jgi:hypothetical protein
MFSKKFSLIFGLIVLMIFLGAAPRVWGNSKELRPASQMNGWITAPLEEGKQALSSGDKVLIALEKPRSVKKGDKLEIFQPVISREEAPKNSLMTKVGRAVVLEISEQNILLCVIESSNREIGVGDRIYWPE